MNKKNKKFPEVRNLQKFIFPILILLCSCGYSTRGFDYGSTKIYIAPAVNKISITTETRSFSTSASYPVLLETRFSNVLINKFNIDGHLKVVSVTNDVLKLTCDLTEYTKESLRYTGSEDVQEQRLRLHVRMKLLGLDGKVIKEKEVVGETSFFLTGPNSVSETTAQSTLIDDTARRVLEAVIEEW